MTSLKGLMVLTALVPLASAWADLSVWDLAKRNAHSVEGRITAILVDEDEKKILLKVETGPQVTQTVKVCSQDVGSDVKSFEQGEKMALMRQAFGSGARVQLSFNGPFDRCLTHITYSQSAQTSKEEPKSI